MKAKRILASVLSVALLLQLSPLGVLALDEGLPQTPQVSTVQENLDPAPTEEPALVEEPAPTAESTPTAAPTTEPAAEPTATPAPEETAAPDAAETPAPEPSAEPTAAPDPVAEVQALIDALPDEVTEDNAEAVEQALTDIDDAKESLTDEQLAGLDFARYDAAANALLALWGEAATDAVELLDNYPQPSIDANDGYYQIYNEGELRWFAEAVNNGNTSSNAHLMNDITINSKVLNDDGSLISDPSSLKSWTPIGTDADGMRFTGTFDGQNHTISGLYIDGTANYVGLFGCIGKNSLATGTVKNVTLADSYVRGNEFVGGICGWNKGGTLQDCHNTGTVSGTTNVGGVCGKNDSGTVDGCYNSGTVSAGFYVGGVCGLINNGSTLKNSYNTGKVSCTNDHVGGVCGWNDASTVQGCYNTGTVSGGESVGGVCGENSGSGTVQECYNTVTVSGTRNVGGVCGMNSRRGTVQGCYNTGKVSGNSYFGGVCGFNDGRVTVEKCYYLVGTSENAVGNIGDDINCESKTETEFKNGAVAYRLQRDLGGTTQVWGQRIGMDKTPVLSSDTTYKVYARATSPCKGGYSNTNDGTLEHNYVNGVCSNCGEWEEAKDVDGYYEIHNQGQLRWFADQVNNNGRTNINARLMNDITINSKVLDDKGELISDTGNLKSWTPIGKSGNSFKGEFDGNSHTIRGLYFNDTNKGDVGLFGFVGAGGTVKNVTLADSYVSGSWYVGGICGQNYGGTVEGCRNTGRVYGTRHYVGGVCGHNEGILQKSCNTGIVTGYEYVGGVCGFNVSNSGSQSTIQECYNTGSVSGTGNYTGGVCGYNSRGSTLEKSYNTGTVSGENIVGGVCGYNDRTVNGCYNIGGVTSTSGRNVGGVCGKNEDGGTVSNCYYLDTIANAIGTGDGINCESKTEAAFKNGEVAYLLQKVINDAATEGTPAEQVWGQTLTEPNKQNYPVLGGDKVYQSAPCPTDYSNGESKQKVHNIGKDGKCTDCGELCIAYTVTIPATVTLGNTVTITATGVTLPDNKKLNVKVAEGSKFEVAQVDDNNKVVDTCAYTVTKGETEVKPGNTVLTADKTNPNNSVELLFKAPATTYSGEYKGTVTFTVSVE